MLAVDATYSDISDLGRIAGGSALPPPSLNVLRVGGKGLDGIAQHA